VAKVMAPEPRQLSQRPLVGPNPTVRNDPLRTFSDPHAPLYDTFNLQPHLIWRPSLRHLRAEARRIWAAATAAA
jgi:hypothetical protein